MDELVDLGGQPAAGTAESVVRRRPRPDELATRLPKHVWQCLSACLDQHQVCRWLSWHRWTVLAMLEYAFLTVVAATERARGPASTDSIPLICNEIQHLFATLAITPIKDSAHRLGVSAWRQMASTSSPPGPLPAAIHPDNHDHHDLRLEY
ncbi:hypothetical protein ABZ863_12745 [Saccharomonospora sp. NPDC046836]|uniref:hypothetical protein n=1 Tax=Saccharomonospora sp. NPDC046836 TaxID=3156921 RepID=UPI003406A9EA